MTIVHRAATLSLAAAFLVGAAGLALADVRSSLSQTQVAEGDSFVLHLQADSTAQGASPDLSVLQRDFTVGGTSQSSSTQVVNGRMSQSIGWAITLTPKSKGTLTVPAVAVGDEESQPLEIEVVDLASLPRANLADSGIEVEMSVAPGNYYVQQEIPLHVQILSAVDMRSAQLTEPSSPDAIITKTGEDRTSRVTMDGRPVVVIDRDYLVKPQKSGPLELAPVTLRARVADENARRRSPFGGGDPFARMRDRFGFSGFGGMPGFGGGSLFDDMMNPGREVVARSEPVTLDIAARPGAATGWFLPAKNVEVRGTWRPDAPDFKAGEAAQRIVQIVALGASKEQLPDLAFADVDGAQIYVERVDDRSQDTGDGTAAIKQYTLSVVPTRGGEVTLPAIEVSWLDSASGEERTAVLAAETITVAGAPGVGAAAAPAPIVAGSATAADAADPLADVPSWVLMATGGGVLVVLAGALLVVVRARRGRAVAAKPASAAARQPAAGLAESAEKRTARRAEAATAVRSGCRRNDPKAAFAALTEWFRLAGATPQTLDVPSADALNRALAEVESRLYGPPVETRWDGRPLLAAFDGVCREREARTRGAGAVGELPPLYAASGKSLEAA